MRSRCVSPAATTTSRCRSRCHSLSCAATCVSGPSDAGPPRSASPSTEYDVARGPSPASSSRLSTSTRGRPGQHGAPRTRLEIEALGRRKEAPLALRRLGVARHLRPGGLDGGVDRTGAQHPADGAGGQVVGERGEVVVEIGQQELDPRHGEAVADRLHQLAALLARQADLGGALVDQPRGRLREARAAELLHRQEQRLLDALERSLRLGIELAHALDVVTDELESERTGVSGREDVEDAATERQIAGILHQRHAVMTPLDQPLGEGVGRHRLALDDVGDRRGELGAGQAALAERLDGAHDHRIAGLQEVVEALRACGEDLARGRQRLERRDLPPRQVVHATAERSGRAALPGVEAQVGGERLRRGRIGGDDEDGARPCGAQARESERRRAAAQSGEAERMR